MNRLSEDRRVELFGEMYKQLPLDSEQLLEHTGFQVRTGFPLTYVVAWEATESHLVGPQAVLHEAYDRLIGICRLFIERVGDYWLCRELGLALSRVVE